MRRSRKFLSHPREIWLHWNEYLVRKKNSEAGGWKRISKQTSLINFWTEYAEDIYPYATFHLPDHENMAGNPERSNYLYENQLKQVSSILLVFQIKVQKKNVRKPFDGFQDPDHYGMLRARHRRKLKSLKSESEEYDSLGSDTDTEQVSMGRTESINHIAESQQYQMGQSTLRRHRKESEGKRERSRSAGLSRPHQSKSVLFLTFWTAFT